MKTCYKCKQSKNYTEFNKSKKHKDGHGRICKICNRERGRVYRLNNIQKIRERSRLYTDNNPEKIKEYHKRYYKKNSNKYYENCKKWTAQNRERMRQLWRKSSVTPKNRHRHRINEAKRRATKLNATPKWLSTLQIKEINEIYDTCPIGYHVDHIIPLRGKQVCGLHVPWNLQHLPRLENIRKNNKVIL